MQETVLIVLLAFAVVTSTAGAVGFRKGNAVDAAHGYALSTMFLFVFVALANLFGFFG